MTTDILAVENAVEKLAAALHATPWEDSATEPGLNVLMYAHGAPTDSTWQDAARAILAADPPLAEALSTGLALTELQKALPEGWQVWQIEQALAGTRGWRVVVYKKQPDDICDHGERHGRAETLSATTAPTIATAAQALTARLREQS